MKYWAKIIDNKVVDTIIAEDDFMDSFTDTTPGEWIEFCNNTWAGVHHDDNGKPDGGIPFRKNRASVGHTYDPDRDAFIPQKPYDSWVLNNETCQWNPPKLTPNPNINFRWDESITDWVFESYPEGYTGDRPY